MPIDISPDGTHTYTGNAIRIFQYKAVQHAIRMEAQGFGRRGMRSGWAKRFGLSPRAKAEAVIERLQQEINKLETEGV
jgi:hypothetical protein